MYDLNLRINDFGEINETNINIKRLMLLEELIQAENQQYPKYCIVI